jgi:hypothetical protein
MGTFGSTRAICEIESTKVENYARLLLYLFIGVPIIPIVCSFAFIAA